MLPQSLLLATSLGSPCPAVYCFNSQTELLKFQGRIRQKISLKYSSPFGSKINATNQLLNYVVTIATKRLAKLEIA